MVILFLIMIAFTQFTINAEEKEQAMQEVIDKQQELILKQDKLIAVQSETISVQQLIAKKQKADMDEIRANLGHVFEWLGDDK